MALNGYTVAPSIQEETNCSVYYGEQVAGYDEGTSGKQMFSLL